jgi:hypothetical protein
MPSLDDDAVEGDSHSAPADAPGAVPADDTTAPTVKDIGKDVIDSTSVADAPVQHFKRSTARVAAARKAFAEKIAESKQQLAATAKETAPDPEDDSEPAAVVADAVPAPVIPQVVTPAAAAPPAPSLDPEVARMRQQLATDREELAKEREKDAAARAEWEKARLPIEASLEDYLDRPVTSYRAWLESMRGEKLTDDDFKAEMHDFVTQASADVLGVPLPESIRTRLEAQQARKIVRTHKVVQAKKEALAAQRAESERAASATTAETERIEQEWTKATDVIGKLFVGEAADKPAPATTAYPWLAIEDAPGKIVVDVIRAAAKKDGTQLSWQEAAKKANDYLESQGKSYYAKRQPLLGAAPAAKVAAPVAKAVTPVAKAAAPVDDVPAQNKKWTRDRHMETTRAAFRQALKTNLPTE